jgi:hypothetical protein
MKPMSKTAISNLRVSIGDMKMLRPKNLDPEVWDGVINRINEMPELHSGHSIDESMDAWEARGVPEMLRRGGAGLLPQEKQIAQVLPSLLSTEGFEWINVAPGSPADLALPDQSPVRTEIAIDDFATKEERHLARRIVSTSPVLAAGQTPKNSLSLDDIAKFVTTGATRAERALLEAMRTSPACYGAGAAQAPLPFKVVAYTNTAAGIQVELNRTKRQDAGDPTVKFSNETLTLRGPQGTRFMLNAEAGSLGSRSQVVEIGASGFASVNLRGFDGPGYPSPGRLSLVAVGDSTQGGLPLPVVLDRLMLALPSEGPRSEAQGGPSGGYSGPSGGGYSGPSGGGYSGPSGGGYSGPSGGGYSGPSGGGYSGPSGGGYSGPSGGGASGPVNWR